MHSASFAAHFFMIVGTAGGVLGLCLAAQSYLRPDDEWPGLAALGATGALVAFLAWRQIA